MDQTVTQQDRGGASDPDEESLRARFYALLAHLLARPPGADLLALCRGLEGDGSELGRAVTALAGAAAVASPGSVEREFQALFIGVGRGELVPYASFYLTGFLNEKPLARLREDMARMGIARVPDVHEPEDAIASLCEMMAGLIAGAFDAPAPLAEQRRFFETHLAGWAEPFFDDLANAASARFYAAVGRLGRAFVAVEKEGFRLAAAAVA